MSSTLQKKTYTVILTRDEDNMITGRCDELHANSEGNTYGEVVQNMKEVIELMIDELNYEKEFNMTIIHNYNDN